MLIVQVEGKLRIRDLKIVLFNIRGVGQIGAGKIIHSLEAYMKLLLFVYCEACLSYLVNEEYLGEGCVLRHELQFTILLEILIEMMI